MTINAKGLLAEEQENRRKLDECPRHRFEPVPRDGLPVIHMGMKWRCTNCGGTCNLSEVAWYRQGVIHAEGEPADVTTVPWRQN